MNNGETIQDQWLQALYTNNVIQVPHGSFRQKLRDDDVSPQEMSQYEREFKTKKDRLKNIDLQVSPLSVGLYNAVVDTGHTISITDIFDKVKGVVGLASDADFKITEFTIRYGKFKTAAKFTKEYGLTNKNNAKISEGVSADFQIKVIRNGETKGASFSFYKSGKIRFSGGTNDLETQPRKLLNFMTDNYLSNVPRGQEINFNNITAEFRVGFPLKTEYIYELFGYVDNSLFDDYYVVVNQKYEDKKIHFLYISFWKGSPVQKKTSEKMFSIILAETGVIQIQGTNQVEDAFTYLKKFFKVLKNNDYMVTGNRGQNITLAGPKKSKLSKRFDNLPAPNITRRGTTCPVNRRPNPYSYIGKCTMAGCYIKPNPQGQPCCYTKPKSLEYSRNKVAAAYSKAGVKVPVEVRTLFGIGLNTNNRPINVANKNVNLNVRSYINNKSGFKIDTRQCLRYTKVALVDMARRLKIVLPVKLTKPILCDLIKKGTLHNVNVTASKKVITGSNTTLRLGSRMCSTYKRVTLVGFARALGGAVTSDMDKTAICKLIQQLSNAKRIVLQTNFNRNKEANKKAVKNAEEKRIKNIENQKRANKEQKKRANQARKNALLGEGQEERNEARAKIKKARNIKARLTRNLVRADILKMTKQNTVNNANVNRLMNIINRAIQNGTIKKTKMGFPLKTSVEKVKRTFFESLKVVPPKKKKKLTAKEKGKGKFVGSPSPSNSEKTPSPPILGLMKIGPNRAGPSKGPRWANMSENNENYNYFMKGPA
jgi:hypothetical protein